MRLKTFLISCSQQIAELCSGPPRLYACRLCRLRAQIVSDCACMFYVLLCNYLLKNVLISHGHAKSGSYRNMY